MLKLLKIVAIVIFVTSCTKTNVNLDIVQDQTAQSNQKMEVALLIPLSGHNKDVGKSLMDGANLALNETKNINLQVIDTGSLNQNNPRMIELLKAKKFDMVLGPVFSSQTKIVYNQLLDSNIPILSFSNDDSLNDHPNLYVLGETIFDSLDYTMNYAISKGYYKVIVLLPGNKYGSLIKNSLNEKANDLLKVIRTVIYPNNINPTNDDLNQIKQDMMEDKSDRYTIIIPEGGKILKSIAVDLKNWALEHHIDIKFLGSNMWDENDLLSFDELNGSWIALTDRSKIIDFEDKFKDIFHYQPFKLAFLVYDAVMIADQYAVNKKIRSLNSDIKFLPNNSSQRKYKMYEFDDNRLVEVTDFKLQK